MKTVYALIGFLEVPLWLYQSPSSEIDPADYESPEYRAWIEHFKEQQESAGYALTPERGITVSADGIKQPATTKRTASVSVGSTTLRSSGSKNPPSFINTHAASSAGWKRTKDTHSSHSKNWKNRPMSHAKRPDSPKNK